MQLAGLTPIIVLSIATLALASYLMRAMRRQRTVRVISHISEVTEGADLFLMSSLPRYSGDERWAKGLPAEAGQQTGQPLHILNGNLRWALHPSTRFRLLITSPGTGEGTSFVAANLAVCMAAGGAKVLLVDAGRSRRVLHKWFQLDDGVGLADLAEEWRGMAAPTDEDRDRLIMRYVRPTRVENLYVLTSGYGSSDPNPDIIAQLPEEMVAQFDAVLLDAPSLHEAGSPWKLPFWHDVLLVSMIGRTRVRAVRHTVRRLQAAQIRTLGVVVNCVPEDQMRWVDRTDETMVLPEIADVPPIPAVATVSRVRTPVQDSSEPGERREERLPAAHRLAPAIAVAVQSDASLDALRDEVARLSAGIADQQAKIETWTGTVRTLEAQFTRLLNEKAEDNHKVEHARAQVDAQQREISRLKSVTAEYRQILARKESMLQEYLVEITAAQALLKMQRERLEFLMQQSGHLPEPVPEKSISSKPSGDISAD